MLSGEMRMKKKIVKAVLMLCMVIGISGCGKQIEEVEKSSEMKEAISSAEENVEMKNLSHIKPEECFVCGQQENSLIPYYAKRDSIGIIHWGSLSVSDTGVRAYDDYGNEIFENKGMSMTMNSFGDDYGSVHIREMAERGISEVSAYFSNEDTVDFEKLSDVLCQKCLDKVTEFYCDQEESGNGSRIGTTGFSLIDFATRELYTLSDPYRGYMIRDYYIQYDIRENEHDNYIDLTIFYAPVREEK